MKSNNYHFLFVKACIQKYHLCVKCLYVIIKNFIIFRKCWIRIHESVMNVFQQSVFNFWEGMKVSCKIFGFENRSYFIILTFIYWIFFLPIMCIHLIIIHYLSLKKLSTNFNCTTVPVLHVYHMSISEFYSWKYLFFNLGD